jgi:hypothetical protein
MVEWHLLKSFSTVSIPFEKISELEKTQRKNKVFLSPWLRVGSSKKKSIKKFW